MFDLGFSELLVIALVALVVLGPERLPRAARFAGLWVRRARAQWYSVRAELERELAAEELKRNLDAARTAASGFERQAREAADELDASARKAGDDVRRGLGTIHEELAGAARGVEPGAAGDHAALPGAAPADDPAPGPRPASDDDHGRA